MPAAEPMAIVEPLARPLTRDDASEAATLIRTAFAAQARSTEPPSSALCETAASVAAKIAAGGGFGLEAGGRLAAVVLWDRKGDALLVGRVAVRPEARGRGLTRPLLAACADEARRQGRRRLTLRVRLELPENERLFERLGFRRYGLDTHPGCAAPTVALMEKLPP